MAEHLILGASKLVEKYHSGHTPQRQTGMDEENAPVFVVIRTTEGLTLFWASIIA